MVEKLKAINALGRATYAERGAHIKNEGMREGTVIYALSNGRTPYEIAQVLKIKNLVLLRVPRKGKVFPTPVDPRLYTTTKPKKPKKPGRHG